MIPGIVGIPIKPFGIAKARLSPVLDAARRSQVGKAVAAHTARSVLASGARPVIVTGDAGVARWAASQGWDTLAEPPGGGLDGAAAAVAAAVTGRWAVLHADLPTLNANELRAAWATDGVVLAPSRDGGTSLIAAAGRFDFRYGPGSFHRHLSASPGAQVLARPGLALDLDTPADLRLAVRLPAGCWLRAMLT